MAAGGDGQLHHLIIFRGTAVVLLISIGQIDRFLQLAIDAPNQLRSAGRHGPHLDQQATRFNGVYEERRGIA